MSNIPSQAAPPIDSPESARSDRQRAIRSAADVLASDEADAPDDADDRCPSCDTRAAWQVSRRHRFSPFGSVLLAVVAFWGAVFSWLFGLGYVPASTLFAAAVLIALATRKAEICEACGYVRRHRR